MIARMMPCDPEALTRLLRDELSSAETETLTQHLDGCPGCRSKLEQLAGGPADWTTARETLAGTTLGRAATKLQPSVAAGSHAADAATDLAEIGWVRSLLQPGDDGGPDRLGPYQIRGLIGQGGMGVVLHGWDDDLGRPLAIKLLSPHLAGSGLARQRFLREARAAAAIVHPNVVPIYSVTADAPVPYLVMPYIGGGNLQQRIDRDGPLEIEELLRIAMQVAEGLAAAHRQGLIHRDIKPGNILLEPGGHRVLISDFGLARALDDVAMTASGVIAGTPPYMSPEQARGESLSRQSDLFSLGSVIYAMASGVPPFRGNSPLAVLHQVGQRPPKPITQLNERMPPWVDALAGALMRSEARERPESAERVAELVGGCLNHVRGPTVHRLPAGLSPRRTPRRRWLAALALACGAVATLVAIPAVYLLAGRGSAPPAAPSAAGPRDVDDQPAVSDTSDAFADQQLPDAAAPPAIDSASEFVPLGLGDLDVPLALLAQEIDRLHRAIADELEDLPLEPQEEPSDE